MLYPNRFVYFEGGPREPQAPSMGESDIQRLEDKIEDEGGLEDRKEAAEDRYEDFVDAVDDKQDDDPELKKLQSSEYRDETIKELSDLSDTHIDEISAQFGEKAPAVATFLRVMSDTGSNEDISPALLARLEGIPGIDVSHDPEDLNEIKDDFIELAAEKIVEQKIAKVKAEYQTAKKEETPIAKEVMKSLGIKAHPYQEFDSATKAYDDAVQKVESAKKTLEQYQDDLGNFDEALTEQALKKVKSRLEVKIAEKKEIITEREQRIAEAIDTYIQASAEQGKCLEAKRIAEKNYRKFESVVDDEMEADLAKVESSKEKWMEGLSQLDGIAITIICGQFGDKAKDVKTFLQVMADSGANVRVSNALLARLEGIEGVDVGFDPEDLNEIKEDLIEVGAERFLESRIGRIKASYEEVKTKPDSAMAQNIMKEMGFTEHPKVTLDKANRAVEIQQEKMVRAEALRQKEQASVAADKLELAQLERSLYFTDEDDAPVIAEKAALKKDSKPEIVVEKQELGPLIKELQTAFPKVKVEWHGSEMTASLNDKLQTQIVVKKGEISLTQIHGEQTYWLKLGDLPVENFGEEAMKQVRSSLEAARAGSLDVKKTLALGPEQKLPQPTGAVDKSLTEYQENFKGLPFTVGLDAGAVELLKKIDFKITKGEQTKDYQLFDVSVGGKVDFHLGVNKDKADSTVRFEVHLSPDKQTVKFVSYNADGTHDVMKFNKDKFVGMATKFKEPAKPDAPTAVVGQADTPNEEMEVSAASDQDVIDGVAYELADKGGDFTISDFFNKTRGLKNGLVAKALEKAAKEYGEEVKQFAADKFIDYDSLLQNADAKFDGGDHVERRTGLRYMVQGIGPERQKILQKLGVEFSKNEIKKPGQKFDLQSFDGKPLVVNGINMDNITHVEVSSSTELEDGLKDPANFKWVLKLYACDSDVVETIAFKGDKVVDYAGLGLTDDQGRLCALSGAREQVDEKQDAVLKSILTAKKFDKLKVFPNHVVANYFSRLDEDHPEKASKQYGIDYAKLEPQEKLFDVAQHKGLQTYLAQK